MNRLNSLLSAGVKLTSTGTAVASPIPFDSSGYFPRFVRVVASGAGCYVKVGDIGVTAVSGDCMVQPLDGVVLNVAGCKAISAISVSGTSSVTVVPLERGSWNYDQRTLDYNFTTLSAVPSPVTYSGGSSRTFFGSDGLLKVQGYNRLTYSSTFTNAAWTKTDVTPTLSDSSPLDVAYLMTEGSAGNASLIQSGAAVTAGSTVALSAVLKRGNTDWVRVQATDSTGVDGAAVWFNLNTGAKGTTTALGAGTSNSGTITSLGGDWYRLTVTTLPNGAYTVPRLFLASASADSSSTRVANATYYVSAAQLETGSTASQYSPTTTAANSAPRLDYDPATLLPRGLLVEEQRTNSLLHSRDMTQAAWGKTDVTAARTQVGIDGTANSACLMTEGSAGNAVLVETSAAFTANSTVTGTFYIRTPSTTWYRIVVASSGGNGGNTWINTSTWTYSSTAAVGTGTNVAVVTATAIGGGWYRVGLTATVGAADVTCNLQIYSTTAAGSTTRVSGATYIVDCAQLEVGSFATSPIITGAATATRSADSASMTGTNFSSWFNASQGTFVVEGDFNNVTVAQSHGVIGTGASARFLYRTASDGKLKTYDGTTVTATGNATAANAVFKSAVSYTAGVSKSLVLNGGTVVNEATCPAPYTAGTALYLGDYGSGAYMNGHLRRLQFYPVALPSAIQSLTA